MKRLASVVAYSVVVILFATFLLGCAVAWVEIIRAVQ